MHRPEILGLTLSQWGFIILAATFTPAGWAIFCTTLRLGRRVRRVGMGIAALMVIGAS